MIDKVCYTLCTVIVEIFIKSEKCMMYKLKLKYMYFLTMDSSFWFFWFGFFVKEKCDLHV
jgi:hypothetical protein